MNATRVSISARRRPGMTFMMAMLLLTVLATAKGAEIVVTATGVIEGGYDNWPLFGVGVDVPGVKGQKDLKGEPFTLVFTFDDTKGKEQPSPVNCPHAGSSFSGDFAASPGTAVLKIGQKSVTFGAVREGHSSAERAISGACSGHGYLSFEVHEGEGLLINKQVMIRIFPTEGTELPTKNPDWKAPLSMTNIDDNGSVFKVADLYHQVIGVLTTKRLIIARN